MLDFEVGSNKIKLSNQNGDLRFREMVWVWIPPIWRAVLSLFYPPVIVRGKNGKNSENPVGSNKSEKRKPKSAVYRSFWASVVYFHLRLISTKSHKGEMTRNAIGRETGARVRLPDAPPNRMDRWILFVCPFFFAGTSPVHPVLWAYGIMLTHCHSIAKRTYKKLKHINNNSYNIDKTIWCGKVKVFWNLYLLQHSKLLKRTKPPLHKKRDGIQVLECRLH